jgi:hypothetical protein
MRAHDDLAARGRQVGEGVPAALASVGRVQVADGRGRLLQQRDHPAGDEHAGGEQRREPPPPDGS